MRILFFLFCFSTSAWGQLLVTGGIHYDALPFDLTVPRNIGTSEKPFFISESQSYLVSFIGLNATAEQRFEIGKQVAVAAGAGIKLSSTKSDSPLFEERLAFSFPFQLSFRYGALATPTATKVWGVAASVGYQNHQHSIPYGAVFLSTEFSLKMGRSVTGLRLSADLGGLSVTAFYTSEGMVEIGKMTQFGVTLFYTRTK
ncbi:MAG: hypothetical protein JNL17_11495 [Cyclobacteriaceae bacterium]|nr:hypothetical protein [Cyclobacteriaceae bacterium]